MTEEYDKKNKPVILTDVVKNWPAYKEWHVEKLMKRFGNSPFKTDEVDIAAKEKLYLGFSDYIEYLKWNNDEDPIYLFDNKVYYQKFQQSN